MPTYEYACTSCGRHVEVVQSFTDEPLTTCPHCGAPLRKVFGNIGIVLKGSGFYKTDSRSAPSAGRSSTDGGKDGSDGTPAKESSGSGGAGSGTDGSGKDKSGKDGSSAGDSSGSSGGSATGTPSEGTKAASS